ncbi:MAG: hypothetical protein L3K14_00250 [Thermoplasmata archaeon]|nr:hypothetical protein [Thermoplasmata archaeon]
MLRLAGLDAQAERLPEPEVPKQILDTQIGPKVPPLGVFEKVSRAWIS